MFKAIVTFLCFGIALNLLLTGATGRLYDFCMLSERNLHYERWVIDDGQPERRVDEDFDWFSVEFWPANTLRKAPESATSAFAVSDYRYHVVAELVFLSQKACVIDFGLRAIGYADSISPECKRGDYVTGEVGLGLPLCTEIVPAEILKSLEHRWQVNGIHADTTPYVPRPQNPRVLFRDESRIQFEPVQATASLRTRVYILHCKKFA